MKAKHWSQKQLKKARWKKSLQRAKKRGLVYGGFIKITDETPLSFVGLEQAVKWND